MSGAVFLSYARDDSDAARRIAEALRAAGVEAWFDRAEDYATADGLVKRAQELDPSDGEIWAVSAEVNAGFYVRGFDRAKSRVEASRSQSQRATQLAPGSARAWLSRGDYFRVGIDWAQAETCLRRALELAPPHGSVHSRIVFGLAGMTLGKGDREAAYRLYGDSIDPGRPASDALAHYNQFLLRFASRRFQEADALAAEAVQEFPSPNFVCGLALSCLAWRGDPELAAAVLAKIPEGRRSETRTTVMTIVTAQLRHRPQEVLSVLAPLSTDYLNDNYFTGPIGLLEGDAQAALGHTEAARLAWERGLEVGRKRGAESEPGGQETAAEVMLLARLGRGPEARRLLAATEEKWGGHLQAWQVEARGYSAMGDADQALPAIQRLLVDTMSAFPLTPALLRLDPLWDKLRPDPRFQALANAQGI